MEFATLTLSIFDPFYTAFGWIMKILYDLVNNYGIVIILFTILVRGIILLPLNIRSQRSLMKQQAVAPLINDIKRRYGDDKQRVQEETMKIYKENGVKMTAGCLPMILQLIIIIPIWRSIQAPLRYIMNVSAESIQKISDLLVKGGGNGIPAGLLTESQAKTVLTNNIPLIDALGNNARALAHVVNEGWMKMSDLLDLRFLGLNLGATPSFKPAKLFGDEMGTYLPLMLIPLLALVTTFLQTKVTEWTSPAQKRLKEQKELAKKNPARQQPDNDPSAAMTNSMKYFMPLMIVFFTFSMPAAMGLYWVVGNILGIAQSYVIYWILYGFPKRKKRVEIVPVNPANP
ncbi:MAG: YidC/Oxa1 family membrane protein insertase [Clostridia bacterium]|nr:YidC/Oxa1 family membrane protein insertase [Clostridia bacterium]